MRRACAHFLVIGSLLACSFGPASSQTTTVYLSRPFPVGARALGLAGAIAGDSPDISVMYGNPAALTFIDNSSILLTHTLERSSNVMEENIALPLFLRRGEVVGIAATVNHVGHLNQTSRNDFKVIQFGYDVAYSRKLAPTLSLGGVLNVRYARSSDSKLWGLSSSFGMFYFPTPDVSYGIALTGVGSGVKYIYDGTRTLLNSVNIPRVFTAGATMRFPATISKRTVLQISLSAEKNFDRTGIAYFGGIEILPVPYVALRLGYVGAPANVEYAAYGIGFRYGKWKLDFGMTPSKVSNEMFQFTLSTSIWNQLEKIY